MHRLCEKESLTVDILLNRLVRQDGATVDVDLVADGDIITKNRHVLETRPFADSAVPANNGRLDPGMVLDTAVLKEDTSLQTHTVANDNIRADGDVGSNAAVLANLGGGVNQDVAAVDVGLRCRREQLRVLARKRREVEAGTRQKVLWLSNVHPEALEVE